MIDYLKMLDRFYTYWFEKERRGEVRALGRFDPAVLVKFAQWLNDKETMTAGADQSNRRSRL